MVAVTAHVRHPQMPSRSRQATATKDGGAAETRWLQMGMGARYGITANSVRSPGQTPQFSETHTEYSGKNYLDGSDSLTTELFKDNLAKR